MSRTLIDHAATNSAQPDGPARAAHPSRRALWPSWLPARWRWPLLALVLAGCGGAELLLIPLFEFGFTGKTGAVTVSLFLGPDKPTTSTGNFTLANLNVDDGVTQVQIPYIGSYSGCTFTLSTTPTPSAPAAASYSGSFQGNDTVELRSSSGAGLPTLSLKRLFAGTVQTGC